MLHLLHLQPGGHQPGQVPGRHLAHPLQPAPPQHPAGQGRHPALLDSLPRHRAPHHVRSELLASALTPHPGMRDPEAEGDFFMNGSIVVVFVIMKKKHEMFDDEIINHYTRYKDHS